MTKDEALLMAINTLCNCGLQIGGHALISPHIHETVYACKEALEQPTEQPTRLEVIDADGRTYTNWKVKELQFSYQDNGKTLKIFVTEVQDDF